ncbi:MAG: ATP-dependent DNA helicase RecG, partial [Planctomycetota bacterium]
RVIGRATKVRVHKREVEQVLSLFPAPFTKGQREIAEELTVELSSAVPMRRLLQGDVGSGKTWVAAFAAALVARGGKQVALMAPTELLAEQHAMGLVPLFESLGQRAVLLTGSLDSPDARRIRADLASGRAQIAIGTHALVSESTIFNDLALAIVDEQHRFGVSQRERLFEKGRDVHALLMTATPIPRTLALTIYGDLETSFLRDRPPGRSTIGTRRVLPEKLDAMRKFLIERMQAGERIYWVAPRIEGDNGAEAAFEEWSQQLADLRLNVELVHGRLSTAERVERLNRFRSGASQLLVGTTVIEVGVDVPEATVMVIDGAQHLGLSQLHQIRGRVGRGTVKSWCFLLGDDSAQERMDSLVQTSDGFEIAELDLLQRGMGSLTGERQAGTNDEGLENPEADLDLLLFARDLVEADRELCSRYAGLPI